MYGNNLVILYQLSSVYIGRSWIDQCSLISYYLLLGHRLLVKIK